MNFIYRSARTTDIAELRELELQCFAHDCLKARNFRWMIRHANASLIVAQQADALAGYALVLFRRGSPVGRLYSLAIGATARGQGLGRALLACAEQQTLARDGRRLRLEVRPDNTVAVGLYESSGYRQSGRVEHYYADDSPALRYEKRLGPQDADI